MRIHPLLDDPHAVLIGRVPTPLVDSETYCSAARQVLAALQLNFDGEDLVVKPNVTVGESFADPDSGIGTHPAFVHGLIDFCLAHGAQRAGVSILEDPRNHDDDLPRHWQGTGYVEVAAATGAQLCCPTADTSVMLAVPRPLARPHLNVSRLAVAPGSILINVPKMKTHNLGITTLCMKNLMGAVYVTDRHFCAQAWQEMPAAVREEARPRHEWVDRALHERWQAGLARRLCDTAQVVRPHLNIVEGVVAREGTGFQRGKNRALGLTVAGVNMVAVDSVASYLMGFDPQDLVYLRMAAEAGLGECDLAQLRIYGAHDGELVPYSDIAALRASPPLRVLSGIVGEDQTLFG